MIKVGLIGCGFMGAMHANCYKNIEGVRVTAFADVRREKARSLAESTDAAIYGDGMDLIEHADVDVIDICLPTFIHARYALRAMDKVKYLFVEKPVALTNEEAAAMLEKSEQSGCRVQVGQVIRFWDEYVELARIIESGQYGKVVNANFRRISPRPTWGWNGWLLDRVYSGGAAQDMHIHDIDYVLSVFGKPASFCTVKNALGEDNSYIHALLRYPDLAVTVEGTWDLPVTHPFEATFRVAFEHAAIENAGGRFMLYTDREAAEITIEKKQLEGGVAGGNISDLGGYYNELAYFVGRVKTGEEIEKATLKEAAESLRFVLEEIERA